MLLWPPKGVGKDEGGPLRRAHGAERREGCGEGVRLPRGRGRERPVRPSFLKCPGDNFIPNVSLEGDSPQAAGPPAHAAASPARTTAPSREAGLGRRAAGSDGQRDEAVVALDVPLEDLGDGAQHALEAGPVQLDALEGPPGHHGGRPGPVQQQRDLPWGRGCGSGPRLHKATRPTAGLVRGGRSPRAGARLSPSPECRGGGGDVLARARVTRTFGAASRPGPVCTGPHRGSLPAARTGGQWTPLPRAHSREPRGTARLPREGTPLTEVVGGPEAAHLHVLLAQGPALQDGRRALWTPGGRVRGPPRGALPGPPHAAP